MPRSLWYDRLMISNRITVEEVAAPVEVSAEPVAPAEPPAPVEDASAAAAKPAPPAEEKHENGTVHPTEKDVPHPEEKPAAAEGM